jgi:hypothetical protein
MRAVISRRSASTRAVRRHRGRQGEPLGLRPPPVPIFLHVVELLPATTLEQGINHINLKNIVKISILLLLVG